MNYKMRYLLIITLLLSLGCKTERINRQLRLSKKHLDRAIFLGAHMDSVMTEVKATGETGAMKDSASIILTIDTAKVWNDIIKSPLITTDWLVIHPPVTGTATNPIEPQKKQFIKALQKDLCPNDSITKQIKIPFTVSGHKYEITGSLYAYSKGGKAGYKLNIGKTDFEYTVKNISAVATPGNEPTVFGMILRYAGVLLIGLIIGFILGKVFKFGVNL